MISREMDGVVPKPIISAVLNLLKYALHTQHRGVEASRTSREVKQEIRKERGS